MSVSTKQSIGVRRNRILFLTQLAMLAGIMLLFHYTGIGYFRIGIFSLTIMAVPMIIGAITLGKTAGAILGAVFAVTVLTLPETQFLFSVNPAATIVLCLVARVLLGFLCGLMFELFSRADKTRIWSYGVTGLVTSVLNTLFVIGGIVIVFGSYPSVQEAFGAAGKGRAGFFITAISAVAVQALIEAAICTLISGAAAKALVHFIKKK